MCNWKREARSQQQLRNCWLSPAPCERFCIPHSLESSPQLCPVLPSLASLLGVDLMDSSFEVLKLAHFHCPNSTDSTITLTICLSCFCNSWLCGDGENHQTLWRCVTKADSGGRQSLHPSLVSFFLCELQTLFQNFITLFKLPTQLPPSSFSAENFNSSQKKLRNIRLNPTQASFQPFPSAVSPNHVSANFTRVLSPLICTCPPIQSRAFCLCF